ncbi:MAG: substrate-binding domain-containing protein, partial [Chloroflexota bacterium]
MISLKSRHWTILVLAVLLTFVLVACGGEATEPTQAPAEPAEEEAAPTEAPAEEEAPEVAAGSVGIVLPTREEPRWIQDETRFRDALEAQGYEVEILFSQGDSAVELANVEQLITQGVEVIILTPQDGAAAAASAEAAEAAGVDMIAYDRLIL